MRHLPRGLPLIFSQRIAGQPGLRLIGISAYPPLWLSSSKEAGARGLPA